MGNKLRHTNINKFWQQFQRSFFLLSLHSIIPIYTYTLEWVFLFVHCALYLHIVYALKCIHTCNEYSESTSEMMLLMSEKLLTYLSVSKRRDSSTKLCYGCRLCRAEVCRVTYGFVCKPCVCAGWVVGRGVACCTALLCFHM